jgi:hypothetical protein
MMPIASFAASFITGLDSWRDADILQPGLPYFPLPFALKRRKAAFRFFHADASATRRPPQDSRRQCASNGYNAAIGPAGLRQELKRRRQYRDTGTSHRKSPPKRACPAWYARHGCPL